MNALEFQLLAKAIGGYGYGTGIGGGSVEVAQVESLFYLVALFLMNKLLMLVEVLLLTMTILKDMELKN